MNSVFSNQLFPNKKMGHRIYTVAKSEEEGLDFVGFARFVCLMLGGDRAQKVGFIFKLIVGEGQTSFSLEDLVSFFRVSNDSEDNREETKGQVEPEREMAIITFELMLKRFDERVTSPELQCFLLRDENNVELFNFLSPFDIKKTANFRSGRDFAELLTRLAGVEAEVEGLAESIGATNAIELRHNTLRRLSRNLGFNLPERNFEVLAGKFLSIGPSSRRDSVLVTPASSRRSVCAPPPSLNKDYRPSAVSPRARSRATKPLPALETAPQSLDSFSEYSISDSSRRNSVGSVNMPRALASLRLIREKLASMKITLGRALDLQRKVEVNPPTLSRTSRISSDGSSGVSSKKFVIIDGKNWNIAASLVRGIDKSTRLVGEDGYDSLSQLDFRCHDSIHLESATRNGFSHCRFKDFAPRVFERVRRFCGVRRDSYVRSIGVNTFHSAFFDQLSLMLSESSSGKSGSFFFHTRDGKYMIKTITKEEFTVLLDLLPEYYNYLLKNPKTLINRFYGLHQMKCYDSDHSLVSHIYVVVMNNVFDLGSPELLQDKFDLKGSTSGRLTTNLEINSGAAKKDLNFLQEKRKFRLSPSTREALLTQISNDTDFLASHNILDYSMLIGIIPKQNPNVESQTQNIELYDSVESHRLGSCIPSADGDASYFMGIIDIFTLFSTKKKGEFVVKSIFDGGQISCIPPKAYRDRFCEFLAKHMIAVPETLGQSVNNTLKKVP